MAQDCAAQLTRRTLLTSDGVTLSLLEAGRDHASKSNLTVALITGWSMPAAIWQGQLERFGQRYHALALDPRGQGDSQVPPDGFTAERRATDLKEFLEPYSKVLLIGWSLGAVESLQYVHMFGAKRLAGMVLVDSSVGEDPAPASDGTFLQALRDDRDKTLDDFVRAIFKKPPSDEAIARLVSGAKRLPLESSIALLSYPFPRAHWRAIAHGFSKPLLYVVTPQYAAQGRNLAKNRPGTRVAVFRDAGHALFVDEPERFNRLILNFAAQLPPR
jgi:microsomal epoxide hydrolase